MLASFGNHTREHQKFTDCYTKCSYLLWTGGPPNVASSLQITKIKNRRLKFCDSNPGLPVWEAQGFLCIFLNRLPAQLYQECAFYLWPREPLSLV